ncbi:hypothetical protein [Mesorhizobium sp. DCY119]|uniref:hypothetical protein n=1 Tax=Mesorhizobium sp. DCY119 TaxID=2108445 RepID=UPI0010586AEE|nr:hypothetical protein [Mesorhizobium sp. DCY119]
MGIEARVAAKLSDYFFARAILFLKNRLSVSSARTNGVSGWNAAQGDDPPSKAPATTPGSEAENLRWF